MFVFFKQKTAYDMRISDWSSDVCSSDLANGTFVPLAIAAPARMDSLPDVPTFNELGYAEANKMSVFGFFAPGKTPEAIVAKLNAEIKQIVATSEIQKLQIGRASCRERVGQYVKLSVVGVALKQKQTKYITIR